MKWLLFALNSHLSFIISHADPTGKRTSGSFESGAPASLSISYSMAGSPVVIEPLDTQLLDITTPVGTSVLTATVSEPKNVAINWNIFGNVPFSINDQGVISVAEVLQVGTYQFAVRASYLGATGSALMNVIVAEGVSSASVTAAIAASADDAEETIATGAIYRSSSDLELIQDAELEITQLIGLRFNDIAIPQGAIITDARIQFSVDETSSGSLTLKIKGGNTDNALTFDDDYSISTRETTAASVSWTPPDWTVVGEAGAAQRTPDLSAVVQEIVNRAGWKRDNSLSFT